MVFKFVCTGFRVPSSERTFSSEDAKEIVKQFNTFLHGCVDFEGTVQIVPNTVTIIPPFQYPYSIPCSPAEPTYIHNAPAAPVGQVPNGPIHLYENIP